MGREAAAVTDKSESLEPERTAHAVKDYRRPLPASRFEDLVRPFRGAVVNGGVRAGFLGRFQLGLAARCADHESTSGPEHGSHQHVSRARLRDGDFGNLEDLRTAELVDPDGAHQTASGWSPSRSLAWNRGPSGSTLNATTRRG